MAWRRAISRVPMDSSAVTTAGSPVGIAATARATPVMNSVSNDCPRTSPSAMTSSNATPAMAAMILDRPSSCFCRGVLSASVVARRFAMWPISVPMPVAVTTISPRPRVTEVFMKAIQVRSPRATSSPGTGSVDLATGRLSPVRAASSISRVAATQIRPSAGTRLPASISTTSPGTSSSASISSAWPSRRTRAMVFIIWASALTLSSALASWRRPITALNTVSPARTAAVATSPVTSRLTRAAASRMSCMTSRYWRRNAWNPDSFLAPVSRFGPWDWSRLRASSTLRPCSGSTPRSRATSDTSEAYQSARVPDCAFLVSWLTDTVFPSTPSSLGYHQVDGGRGGACLPHLFQVISPPAAARASTVIGRYGFMAAPLRSGRRPEHLHGAGAGLLALDGLDPRPAAQDVGEPPPDDQRNALDQPAARRPDAEMAAEQWPDGDAGAGQAVRDCLRLPAQLGSRIAVLAGSGQPAVVPGLDGPDAGRPDDQVVEAGRPARHGDVVEDQPARLLQLGQRAGRAALGHGLASPEPGARRGVEPQAPPDDQPRHHGQAPAYRRAEHGRGQQAHAENGAGHHPPSPGPPAVAPLLALAVAATPVGGLRRGPRLAAARVDGGVVGDGRPVRHRPDLLGQLLDPGSAQALDGQRGAAGVGPVTTAGRLVLPSSVGHGRSGSSSAGLLRLCHQPAPGLGVGRPSLLRDLRHMQVERVDGVDQDGGDHRLHDRLVVGGEHVPGCPGGGGGRDRLLEGPHVVVPACPFGEVGRAELPLLARLVEAGQEAPLLLC